MGLGNRVRTFRLTRGERLRELARGVNMDPSHLSRIERGLQSCSDEDKLALARHFDVPVTDLFFQEAVA